MTRCLIFSARQFSIVDEDKPNSAPYEGVSLSYLDLTAHTPGTRDVSRARGVDVFTISGSKELWASCENLPGFYDVDFAQRPGKGGRPQLQIRALQFLTPFALSETGGVAKKS